MQETLAAEPGVDRHDEHDVDQVQHRGSGAGGRGRVEHQAGLAAQARDGLQGAVGVRAGLGMDQDVVGAGLGEGGQIGVGRGDHQVDVERQAGERPQGAQHHRAEADVGHEMPVHHVQVQPVPRRRLGRRRPPRPAARNWRRAGWVLPGWVGAA